MKYSLVFAIVASVLFLGGCSGKNQDLDTGDPAKYAEKIKNRVHNMVEAVRRSPGSAREQASVLLEELEVYEKQPVGEHETVYAQLLQNCWELVEAAGRSGSGAEVARKLNEMKALADKLPGTVTLEPAG